MRRQKAGRIRRPKSKLAVSQFAQGTVGDPRGVPAPHQSRRAGDAGGCFRKSDKPLESLAQAAGDTGGALSGAVQFAGASRAATSPRTRRSSTAMGRNQAAGARLRGARMPALPLARALRERMAAGRSSGEIAAHIAARVGGDPHRWLRYVWRICAGQRYVLAEVADVICIAGLDSHPATVWGAAWDASAPADDRTPHDRGPVEWAKGQTP